MLILNTKLVYLVFVSCCVLNVAGQHWNSQYPPFVYQPQAPHPSVNFYSIQNQQTPTQQQFSDAQQNTARGAELFDSVNCGQTSTIITNKIFGGTNTEIGEFPWMTLLQYYTPSGVLVIACDGILISKRYVLTAAHCVTGSILVDVGSLYSVRLGEWNTETDPDCITYCSDLPIDVVVEEIIPHSEYNLQNQTEHDIGLIRLIHDIQSTEFIRPICMPSLDFRSLAGESVTVAGWGRTLEGRQSPILQKLELDIASRQTCEERFLELGRLVGDDQICAGGKYKENTCDGDSGGPLMKEYSQKWFLEGIVSFGHQFCGTSGWPSVYTRVSSYLDWINYHVRD